MTRNMSPRTTVVSLPDGRYRIVVTNTLEVEVAELGSALAELAPGVTLDSTMKAVASGDSGTSSCDHGAQRAPATVPAEPPARLPESQIERDNRGRMKLEPFLRAIARSGGLDWADRVGIAKAAGMRGWETSNETMDATAAKVLTRLIDGGASWIQRRGGQRSRQYKILPLTAEGGSPP